MASGPITSWQIDEEIVTDFNLLGSKITSDGDCSHEIKRHLILGRKATTSLDSILKSRDITFPTNAWIQDLLELTLKKDILFIIGDWNAKVGSQESPGVTGKFGLGMRNEAGQRLIEFCQENSLVIANTLFQQQKRRLYTWTSPDGQHWNQIDHILCSKRWRSYI